MKNKFYQYIQDQICAGLLRSYDKIKFREAQKALIFFSCLMFFSCKTYTISPDSFKAQFIGIDSTALKTEKIKSAFLYVPGGVNLTYSSNKIKNIYVFDKKGNKKVISNSPALEMRVTLRNSKKYHFYFDTVVLHNDTLSGGRSRFASNLVRKIPFSDIVKIEIQDGGKKMHYTN
jgi:hypothetical protein